MTSLIVGCICNMTLPFSSICGVTSSANPEKIFRGDISKLKWTTSGYDECKASVGWTGNKETSGEEDVSPVEDTDYRLTCTNRSGAKGSKQVEVAVKNGIRNVESDNAKDALWNSDMQKKNTIPLR